MGDITRRDFVEATASLAFGAMIVPRHVLGRGFQAPSDTLNLAVVGMGQQGTENIEEMISENLVSVCDVDFRFMTSNVTSKLRERDGKERPKGVQLNEKFGKAAKYTDFRAMFDRQKDIDGVVIATPDHLHAHVARVAMQLGKHVYVQKPLASTVKECRVLAQLAKDNPRVVTQMGNQGHSSKEARQINEWIQAGVIGPVREINIYTNRPIWPQGVPRPLTASELLRKSAVTPNWNRTTVREATAAALTGNYALPDGMRWDLYLGPVPNDLEYHPIYHPFNWRGWVDFGVGALGDMGAHLIDHPFWALDLGYPVSVEATSTPWGGTAARPASYPLSMTAHYDFAARGDMPPVQLNWYDGGLYPRRPSQLPDTVVLNPEGSVIYIGEKGILVHETYGRNPKLYPESLMEQARLVPEKYPRVEGTHHMNWVNACKGTTKAVSPFEYAAPLTEVMLLGVSALRAGQGRKLYYDAAQMKFSNAPDADQYLTREYRKGWEL